MKQLLVTLGLAALLGGCAPTYEVEKAVKPVETYYSNPPITREMKQLSELPATPIGDLMEKSENYKLTLTYCSTFGNLCTYGDPNVLDVKLMFLDSLVKQLFLWEGLLVGVYLNKGGYFSKKDSNHLSHLEEDLGERHPKTEEMMR